MQIKPAQLPAQLAKGLRPLYVLHGDEALLVQEAQDSIRAAARAQGHTERSSHIVSGAHFDWGPVLAAGQSLSLFAERQMLEIRIPSGKPGRDGSTALQQLAEHAPGNDSLLTLVVLPRLDRQTRNSAWFKALDSAGISVQIDPVERPALPQWIAQRLAAQGQRVAEGPDGQATLQFFADRVEGNLLAAHQEIQKLALLHPPGELSREHIESAVLNVARYDVFKLSQAALSGQPARVQRMIDGLRAEGEAAVLVHWALAEDIRNLKRAQDALASGTPPAAALGQLRVWGDKQRLFERLLPGLRPAHTARLLQSAHRVDGIVKGLPHPDWPSDPWQALHRLGQQLCRASLAAHGRA